MFVYRPLCDCLCWCLREIKFFFQDNENGRWLKCLSDVVTHTHCVYICTDRGDEDSRGGVTPVWLAALGAMGVIMEFPELPPGSETD